MNKNAANTLKRSLAESKRIEEDCLYSAKGHFVCSSLWTQVHWWLGIPTAVFAAIAGASTLSQFDHHNIISGSLSIAVVILTSIITFMNPNEKAHVHLGAGNKYNSLRNQARILYAIEANVESTAELAKRVKELSRQRDELNQQSPQIPRWAFRRARNGVEEGEAFYQVDATA